MDFLNEIEKHQYLQELEIEKSVNPNLISIYDLQDLLKSGYEIENVDESKIEKAERDLSHLVKKEVWVQRGGKSFKQTVYVKIKDDEKVETPVGGELSPDVKGMKITKYSDKSILITGDTYVNKDTLRDIKKEIGVGTFNPKLKGWIYPLKYVETVLGYIWSDLKNKGEDEKADAVQNQKNAALQTGDKAEINGTEIEVKENVSDSEGTKYNVKLGDGTELNGVDEKVINKEPETDDKKIADAVNNASPENRVSTEKKIYGVKPIKDIHNYTLAEYMGMHGLDQEDIDKAIAAFTKPKKEGQKRSSGGSSKPKGEKKESDGLTKKQLIAKLIYAHYQAVQKAVKAGEKVRPEVLAIYADLQQEAKDRKPMSEETKRKISEALKKNKVDEIELPKTKKEDSPRLKKEKDLLEKEVAEKDSLEKEKYKLFEDSRKTDDYSEKGKIQDKGRSLNPRIDELTKSIQNKSNAVQALSNGGDLIEITDKVGIKYKDIPSFVNVDTINIDYDIDNILTKEKPAYIPEINEEDFRSGSYIFDMIRLGEDKYLLATNKYKERSQVKEGFSLKEGEYNPNDGGFVELTLDQLVLTQDYYVTKKKAEFKAKSEKQNKAQEANWDKKEDTIKEKYLMQRGMYRSLPAKLKKKITETQWESMPWQEREKHYKPIKKYGVERIKSRFDNNTMANSFHSMYERFVNPEATRKDSKGKLLKRGERSYGTSYAAKEAFQSWKDFRQTLDWKINDINIQREELSNIRSKAIETSYGMSNTNDSLLKSDGILVKRQNGEDIKPQEIEQLQKAWSSVQKSFGTLKENAIKDNLKLSHAGKTYMFASKAIGVYVPSMKTIGVTAKYGEDQLGFTLGHEAAHWIDGTLGAREGKRHMSDNYESTAGKIATTFRANMNAESKSNYINATHENFARAFEMYHAVESQGKDALLVGTEKYITNSNYVSFDTYTKQIKPLIEQFFSENKEFLKSTLFDLFK